MFGTSKADKQKIERLEKELKEVKCQISSFESEVKQLRLDKHRLVDEKVTIQQSYDQIVRENEIRKQKEAIVRKFSTKKALALHILRNLKQDVEVEDENNAQASRVDKSTPRSRSNSTVQTLQFDFAKRDLSPGTSSLLRLNPTNGDETTPTDNSGQTNSVNTINCSPSPDPFRTDHAPTNASFKTDVCYDRSALEHPHSYIVEHWESLDLHLELKDVLQESMQYVKDGSNTVQTESYNIYTGRNDRTTQNDIITQDILRDTLRDIRQLKDIVAEIFSVLYSSLKKLLQADCAKVRKLFQTRKLFLTVEDYAKHYLRMSRVWELKDQSTHGDANSTNQTNKIRKNITSSSSEKNVTSSNIMANLGKGGTCMVDLNQKISNFSVGREPTVDPDTDSVSLEDFLPYTEMVINLDEDWTSLQITSQYSSPSIAICQKIDRKFLKSLQDLVERSEKGIFEYLARRNPGLTMIDNVAVADAKCRKRSKSINEMLGWNGNQTANENASKDGEVDKSETESDKNPRPRSRGTITGYLTTEYDIELEYLDFNSTFLDEKTIAQTFAQRTKELEKAQKMMKSGTLAQSSKNMANNQSIAGIKKPVVYRPSSLVNILREYETLIKAVESFSTFMEAGDQMLLLEVNTERQRKATLKQRSMVRPKLTTNIEGVRGIEEVMTDYRKNCVASFRNPGMQYNPNVFHQKFLNLSAMDQASNPFAGRAIQAKGDSTFQSTSPDGITYPDFDGGELPSNVLSPGFFNVDSLLAMGIDLPTSFKESLLRGAYYFGANASTKSGGLRRESVGGSGVSGSGVRRSITGSMMMSKNPLDLDKSHDPFGTYAHGDPFAIKYSCDPFPGHVVDPFVSPADSGGGVVGSRSSSSVRVSISATAFTEEPRTGSDEVLKSAKLARVSNKSDAIIRRSIVSIEKGSEQSEEIQQRHSNRVSPVNETIEAIENVDRGRQEVVDRKEKEGREGTKRDATKADAGANSNPPNPANVGEPAVNTTNKAGVPEIAKKEISESNKRKRKSSVVQGNALGEPEDSGITFAKPIKRQSDNAATKDSDVGTTKITDTNATRDIATEKKDAGATKDTSFAKDTSSPKDTATVKLNASKKEIPGKDRTEKGASTKDSAKKDENVSENDATKADEDRGRHKDEDDGTQYKKNKRVSHRMGTGMPRGMLGGMRGMGEEGTGMVGIGMGGTGMGVGSSTMGMGSMGRKSERKDKKRKSQKDAKDPLLSVSQNFEG